ncbi:MAG: (p)ppGpp synthetase, partial [Gammaproteobacteria bacterium]|nr:(p)ppGpp synthetase [Gammaproteobacteria bacterium]NIR82439.1 (p)ppGpp synthetase [Gammaproteobacteria bacterium]NIU06713.1 (p)ppGpp synthetase [Gammaproteobacteria bacterium]NIV53541.1 (p)ppGpp synthetase [Gammaproteobacteria bacterium]NIX87986.1 (p)ppGpp synthetase [Gammaproteobacteria bacterium]
AIVRTRAKKIPSFAEKTLRKRHKYSNPVEEFTDLCGGRVIARTRSEVRSLCDYIEDKFDIDW